MRMKSAQHFREGRNSHFIKLEVKPRNTYKTHEEKEVYSDPFYSTYIEGCRENSEVLGER